MDLPTCPACGQSVLDDEAETCPFCGASMSGKPTTATKAPTAAKTPPARKAAPAKPTKAGSRPTAAAKSDDPFAVGAEAAQGAVRLSPKPTKGATYRVVCPMCETPGYAPRPAAGKDVRCVNPDCLVPVFTAPKLPPEPAATEPEPKRSPAALLAVGGVAVLGLAGALLWLFVLRDPTPDRLPPLTNTSPTDGTDDAPSLLTGIVDRGQTDAKETDTAAAELNPAAVQPQVLDQMVKATRDVDPADVHKPALVRSTAEAFALAGRFDELPEQLDRLEVRYYRILPLTIKAWQQLAAGNQDAARQTVDEAFQYVGAVSSVGHEPWNAATALAAALAAIGRDDEARGLLRKSDSEPERQQSRLWAELAAVRALGTYNLDQFLETTPVVPWSRPQPVAVTYVLVGHGRWDEARRWSAGLTDAEAQIESTAAWAQVAAASPGGPLPTVETATQSLPPAEAAQVLARAAGVLAARGEADAAREFLQKAQQSLSSVQVPEPVQVSEIGDVWRLGRPRADTYRRAAVAAAEIARAQSRLGSGAEAWQSLQSAVQFAQATGPSLSAIQPFADQFQSSQALVRNQLTDLLELRTEDEIRRALRDYRRKIEDLRAAAEDRLRLEEHLLSSVTDPAVVQLAAGAVLSRATAANANEQQPFGRTALPLVLAGRLESAGHPAMADELRKLAEGGQENPDRVAHELDRSVAASIEQNQFEQAADLLQQSKADQAVRQRIALRTANRLIAQDRWADARRFVQRFSDPLFQEEALELIAAQAVVNGQFRPVWTAFQEPKIRPGQQVALGRGLIAGLQRLPAQDPPPATGTAGAGASTIRGNQ